MMRFIWLLTIPAFLVGGLLGWLLLDALPCIVIGSIIMGPDWSLDAIGWFQRPAMLLGGLIGVAITAGVIRYESNT